MPQEKSEQVKDVEADVKKYALLEAVENSEGGQMIIVGLKKDVVSAIEKLKSLYKTASEIELRTWCAILDSRFTMLQAYSRAGTNRKFAVETLDELMKSIDVENGNGG